MRLEAGERKRLAGILLIFIAVILLFSFIELSTFYGLTFSFWSAPIVVSSYILLATSLVSGLVGAIIFFSGKDAIDKAKNMKISLEQQQKKQEP